MAGGRWIGNLFLVLNFCASAMAFKFSIVIDAGSTGCRLYVYQVTTQVLMNEVLFIDVFEFELLCHTQDDHSSGHITGKVGAKVKPGLSTFKTHPQDLKEFISPLFKEAQTLVPQSEW